VVGQNTQIALITPEKSGKTYANLGINPGLYPETKDSHHTGYLKLISA